MPELTCSLEIGPALSEPVQLADGRVLVACETPLRDAIQVLSLVLDHEPGVAAFRLETLPGGPTDNGTRAMWPRMAGNGAVGYQRGSQNVIRDLDGVWQSRGDGTPGRVFGVWTIGVAQWGVLPTQYHEAPPSTSQGVFGYFDGRWWLYDEIRESRHQQQWAHLGTLSHAWEEREKRAFLYKHGRGTFLRIDFGNHDSVVYHAFDGYAEYPRGCVLQDGRLLVVAVGERVREITPGVWTHRLRVAVSPFEQFESEEPQVPGTIRLESAEAVRGGIVCIVRAEGAQGMRYTKRIRVARDLPGGLWDGVEQGIATRRADGRFQVAFNVNDPGSYEVSVVEDGTAPIPAFVKVTEGWPVPPPEKVPQVVTPRDYSKFASEQTRINLLVNSDLGYVNARCAGQSHDEAIQAYHEAVIAVIRGGQ